jgi:hypothetical protein
MSTLRDALSKGALDQFIAEHEGETGNADALEALIRSMAGMSKEAPATSPPDGSDD